MVEISVVLGFLFVATAIQLFIQDRRYSRLQLKYQNHVQELREEHRQESNRVQVQIELLSQSPTLDYGHFNDLLNDLRRLNERTPSELDELRRLNELRRLQKKRYAQLRK